MLTYHGMRSDYYNYRTADGSLSVVSFSSRGPTSDGRIKPDVVCPGTYIRSASSDGIINSNQCGAFVSSSTNFGGSVLSMSGTSVRNVCVCMCVYVRACVSACVCAYLPFVSACVYPRLTDLRTLLFVV